MEQGLNTLLQHRQDEIQAKKDADEETRRQQLHEAEMRALEASLQGTISATTKALEERQNKALEAISSRIQTAAAPLRQKERYHHARGSNDPLSEEEQDEDPFGPQRKRALSSLFDDDDDDDENGNLRPKAKSKAKAAPKQTAEPPVRPQEIVDLQAKVLTKRRVKQLIEAVGLENEISVADVPTNKPLTLKLLAKHLDHADYGTLQEWCVTYREVHKGGSVAKGTPRREVIFMALAKLEQRL